MIHESKDYQTTFADVGNFVADCRFGLKLIEKQAAPVYDNLRAMRKDIDRLKNEDSPFNRARIDRLNLQIEAFEEVTKIAYQTKVKIGESFMSSATWIDANTSFEERLMLFSVNKADAAKLPINASTTDIVYVHKLSDSAAHRDKDFSGCVLTEACISFFCDQLLHNDALKEKADKFLFGKGGMFEFLPTYKMNGDEMIRNPPRLRIADECDIKTSTQAA